MTVDIPGDKFPGPAARVVSWASANERRTEMTYKVYVCGPGEVGPQCGYVSYLAGMEYGPKRVPMHTHLKTDGNWLETAWGPADKCKYPKRRPDLAVEARNEQQSGERKEI